MSKKYISIHKDIKVVELDTDKQYAIYTGNLYWIDKFDIIFLEAKYAI